MDYKIEPENNCLNSLEKNTGKKLSYKLSGTESNDKMAAIHLIKVEGLSIITDGNHVYTPGYVYDGNITYDRTKTGADFKKEQKLKDSFVFEFENVYLNPNHNPEIKQATLKVTLFGKDKEKELAQLPAFVRIAKNVNTIEYFHINPSFLYNSGVVKLSWKCRNISEYSIHYADGGEVDIVGSEVLPEIDDNGVCEGINLPIKIVDTSEEATHIYLKTSKGEQVAKEINKRKIITPKTGWNTTALSQIVKKKKEISEILQLIGNEYDYKIWTLGRYKKEGSIRLWQSNTGGTDDWEPVGEEAAAIEKEEGKPIRLRQSNTEGTGNLEPVGEGGSAIIIEEADLHRPSVFYASAKNEPARLYFIGGSLLEIRSESASNQLCSYDVDVSRKIKNRRQEHEPIKGDPIMGHSCVVFPDANGIDNIWVIGGLDEFGNGLNEVKRWDGKQWHQETTPEGFPARCQFSATVLRDASAPEDMDKMEIWIGGGFEAFEGNPVRDIWKYSKTKNGWSWGQVFDIEKRSPMTICEHSKWLVAAALISMEGKIFLTYVTKNQDGREIAHCWIVFDNEYKTGDITREGYRKGAPGGSPSVGWDNILLGGGNSYCLQTLGFNGCVWLIAQQDSKQDYINLSKMYYLVPEQTNKNS